MELRLETDETGFSLVLAGRTVLRHSRDCPSVTVARGQPSITMLRGNFRIEDAPRDAITPRAWHRERDAVVLCDDARPVVRIAWNGAELTIAAA